MSQIKHFIKKSAMTPKDLEVESKEYGWFDLNIIKQLAEGCIPNILYFALVNLGMVFNLYFISSANNDETLIASIGVGNTWIEATCYTLIASVNCGLNTLISQAYGAKDYNLVAKYFQRGLLINSVVLLSISVLSVLSADFFNLFGYDKDLSASTGKYIIYMMPEMAAYVLFDTLKTYAQGHTVFAVPMYIHAGCGIFEIFTSYYFIKMSDWGLLGYAISRGICELNKCIILIWYIRKNEAFKETFIPFESDFYIGTVKQVWFQVHCGAVIYIEMLAYYVEVFFAATLGKQMTALTINNSIMVFVWGSTCGINYAISTFVSKAMGEKDIALAKGYLKNCITGGNILILLISLVILAWVRQWGQLFTDDKEILWWVSTLLIIYSLTSFMDNIQNIFSATLRSVGKERVATLIFILSFYLIGFPIGLVLGFPVGLGVIGLILGSRIAMTISVYLFGKILLVLDWKHQAYLVTERMAEDNNLEVKKDITSSLKDIEMHLLPGSPRSPRSPTGTWHR